MRIIGNCIILKDDFEIPNRGGVRLSQNGDFIGFLES